MIFLKKVINSVVKTSPPKGDNPLPLQAPAAGAGRGCALRVLGVFFVYLQKMFKFIHPKIMSY